jgi:hypothetical protein
VNIRFLIALAAILFSALPSLSQTNSGWDDRFFPTTQKPLRVKDGEGIVFASDVIISQMVYAVNERWIIAYKEQETPANRTWSKYQNFETLYPQYIRKPETALEDVKSAISSILFSYVRSYDEDNFVPELVEYYTLETLLIDADLPENFFEFTPVRNLMGNSAIGTNSAYGWDGAYRCLNLLTNTLEIGVFAKYENRVICEISGSGLSDGFDSRQALDFPQLSFSYGASENLQRWDSPGVDSATKSFDYGKKTYRTISSEVFEQHAYVVTNAIAKPFQTVSVNFDLEPGAESFFAFVSCPEDYFFEYPNKDVVDQFSALCASNTQYQEFDEISYSDKIISSDYVYPVPNTFTEAESGPCNASSILSAMKCVVLFQASDQTFISDCEQESDIGSGDRYKRASTSASASFVNIVSWGFKYK